MGTSSGVLKPGETPAHKNGGTIARLTGYIAREVGIRILGFFGILTGLASALIIFPVSLIRGARFVHAEGVLCKADIFPLEVADPGRAVGGRFSGPALVRFSGATKSEGDPGKDNLGLALRMRAPREVDGAPEVGDQDLVFGTFKSLITAVKDNATVDSGDYLANVYYSVTPWRIRGIGLVHLRILAAHASKPGRLHSRLERLEADIEAGDCKLVLGYCPHGGGKEPVTPMAMLKVTSVSPLPPQQLRTSLFRTGRNAKAVGFRNGIRRIAYPVSQLARRIRGG
jgi:hypothetical protein